MPTITKLYSMGEASQHNTREDCWVVIDGKVYDVTEYLDEHPGGDDVLLSATGRDSTEEFEDAGHSQSARELMQDYCIGELDPTPTIPELEISRKDQPSNFASKALQYWAMPAVIVGISVVAVILYSRKNEEAVECRHDLRAALAEELAEAVLAVLLTLFCVVEDSSGAVGFVDSATQR